MSDSETYMAATEYNAEALISQSQLDVHTPHEKTLILTAKLPNGYEVTVSSSTVDPVDFDDDVGMDVCMEKLKDKVIDLLAFQQHGTLE